MSVSVSSSGPSRTGLALVLVLFVVELAAIGVIYKHLIDFTCLENWPRQVCSGASGLMVSIYTMAGALVLLAMLLPGPVGRLVSEAGPRRVPLLVNLAGVVAMLAPLPLMQEGSGTSNMGVVLAFWAVGLILGATGAVLMLAPARCWMEFLRARGGSFLFAATAGFLAPPIAVEIRPWWRQFEGIADVTFAAASRLIRLFGYEVDANPATKVIGAGDFYISVAPVCSGIEGMALVTVFVTIFLVLFRRELSFPAAFLLYPIGILASALLNIVRIVVLLAIGLNGHPELAVGGFHSHAGWLMFTTLSVALIAVARTIPFFADVPQPGHAEAAKMPPFFSDPAVAQILPFAVFMASALLASTFSQTPALLYPARVLMMTAALILVLPVLRRLAWGTDAMSIGIGVLVGLMWVLVPVATPDAAPPFAGLAGAVLVGWILFRGIGTIVLVPIIEENFFRGYLEQRLTLGPGLAWILGAAAVSAVIFALLHDRWAEAFVASLAFSYACRRRGRVADAIWAHGAANAVVFAVAFATDRYHLI